MRHFLRQDQVQVPLKGSNPSFLHHSQEVGADDEENDVLLQCEECGKYYHHDDYIETCDQSTLCPRCLHTYYVYCDECQKMTPKETSVSYGFHSYCEECEMASEFHDEDSLHSLGLEHYFDI